MCGYHVLTIKKTNPRGRIYQSQQVNGIEIENYTLSNRHWTLSGAVAKLAGGDAHSYVTKDAPQDMIYLNHTLCTFTCLTTSIFFENGNVYMDS